MSYNRWVLKKIIIIPLFTVVGLVFFLYFNFYNDVSLTDQITNQGQNTLSINGIGLKIEIADDPIEQSQGLSNRESLASDGGMLFIFPQPTMPGFWMKDMKFSLHLIWIDANGEIVEITRNVSPTTYPKSFLPPSPIKYVLEVNAGWADKNNVKVGNEVMGP